MHDITGAALEYVADDKELTNGPYDIADAGQAAAAIDHYLRARVTAAVARSAGRPVLQLSGGIDSILLATYVAEVAPGALAVTYSQQAGTLRWAGRQPSQSNAVSST